MALLTKNFSSAEFACRCGCGLDDIDPALVDKLQQVRDLVGVPLTVTSGVRCWPHNTAIGGAKRSPHPDRIAADIACSNSMLRFRIIAAALRVGFNRIGIGRDFIHLDISGPERAQSVAWLY